MAIDSTREIALKILYDINEKGAYSNISINKYLEGHELKSIDRAFITDMVYGAVKWRLTIDWIIEQFSSVKIKKISPWILNILRLGVYQLIYTDKVPESAACNESVNLAKRYGHQASSRYVNGVLRGIARNKDGIKYPDKKKNFNQFLSVKYSHPQWLVDQWIERFGRDFTESLLSSNNEIPDFTVRVNTLKASKEQLIESLKESGIDVENGKHLDEAVVIKNPSSITKLEAFKKGYFQVQDESSMLVAKVLDPKPGEFVMDVCSAPGGKSTHIAQIMNNEGTVISRDVHEHKIKIIEEAVNRLGIRIVKTELFNAVELDERHIEKADRVLIDAPCTGLGIIRKKPDIKWARNIEDKKEITALQRRILDTCSRYVKPGGFLVYSTCTIEHEENEDIIEGFLKENKSFQPVDIAPLLPEALKKPGTEKGYVQLYPNVDRLDGFFIAKLQKRR
ncbi:MAG: 16S rRNA (cytosine(967)-C(5))-methyltransferase RsmB [Clostridia bacterium]|nr:16S rRNA (cytosine(967)-C(5))-methyltransferase RsmB [Clostridia bacterium]